jgi:hypothetical protein
MINEHENSIKKMNELRKRKVFDSLTFNWTYLKYKKKKIKSNYREFTSNL